MNQAQLRIENEVMTVSDADFEASSILPEGLFEESDWDVESLSVAGEKLRLGDTPGLLFFWDGIDVHRITD